MLDVGVLAAGVVEVRLILAEHVDKFGFSDAASAVQHDKFRFLATIAVRFCDR